jgi:hypothetical protein
MLKAMTIVLGLMLLPGLLGAEEKKEDVWDPFRFFLGSWEGTGEGSVGEPRIEASFNLTLGSQFIEVRHRSVFEPQENNPKGEIHEDRGFISYDQARSKYVFRQFHVECFVNQYLLDSLSADGKTLVFLSEAVENGPPGWRAKLTHEILNEDEYLATFELAPPEKEFSCYIQNRLRRKK